MTSEFGEMVSRLEEISTCTPRHSYSVLQVYTQKTGISLSRRARDGDILVSASPEQP